MNNIYIQCNVLGMDILPFYKLQPHIQRFIFKKEKNQLTYITLVCLECNKDLILNELSSIYGKIGRAHV